MAAAAFSTLLGSAGNAALVGPASTSGTGNLFMSPPHAQRIRMRIQSVASKSISCSSSVYELCPLIYHRDHSNAAAEAAAAAVLDYKEMEEERKDSVTAEKMDRWIKDSVGEIVRNIGEAPFLVQIFSQGPSVLSLEREEASPDSWPLVKKRWNESNRMPDGVILVEEIKDKSAEEEAAVTDFRNNESDSESQTWGLVVQGRGMDCAAPCYILNTCRVRSSAGFCTHFCLVRAKCFGETLDKQLSKAWLQGR